MSTSYCRFLPVSSNQYDLRFDLPRFLNHFWFISNPMQINSTIFYCLDSDWVSLEEHLKFWFSHYFAPFSTTGLSVEILQQNLLAFNAWFRAFRQPCRVLSSILVPIFMVVLPILASSMRFTSFLGHQRSLYFTRFNPFSWIATLDLCFQYNFTKHFKMFWLILWAKLVNLCQVSENYWLVKFLESMVFQGVTVDGFTDDPKIL